MKANRQDMDNVWNNGQKYENKCKFHNLWLLVAMSESPNENGFVHIYNALI